LIKDASETDEMAQELEGNDDVYLVPAFVGLGAPFWDPEARGLLIGITRGTGKKQIVRAALEALAYQTRDVVEEMKQLVKFEEFNVLRVDGGAVNNEFLLQFQSDILGLSVERPKDIETTVFGAAAIAGLGSGFWKQSDLDKIRKIDKVFEPNMDEDLRTQLYVKWQSAVQKSLAWADESP
jgi:glycerol kinase